MASRNTDVLKLIGTVDLVELYENLCKGLKPVAVNINSGYKVTHNHHNGSGGCGDLPDSKTKRTFYKATIENDNSRPKYGVDAVFGFTGSVWNNELEIKYGSFP